ncbi:MAG: hypothetical protein NW217_05420 [Hyphomicrobiaceae bacterium]|nr:hypothetical protein [Hyphomicrobiaceae bacterium]
MSEATTTVVIHIIVDADGDHVIGTDADECVGQWEAQMGTTPVAMAHYEISIQVPIPDIQRLSTRIGEPGGSLQLRIVK